MTENNMDIKDLKYEQAFAELEKIVAALEEDQAALEDTMKLFERGQKLAEHCAALLNNAELRLKVLGEEAAE